MEIVGTFISLALALCCYAVWLTFTVVMCVKFFMVLKSGMNRTRGTNAVTRFVRDSSAHASFTTGIVLGSIHFVISLICALLTEFAPWKLLLFIPGIAVLAASFFFMKKSNDDPQRVADARTMTKTATEIADSKGFGTAVGIAAAGVAIAATGGGAALAAPFAAGGTAAAGGAAAAAAGGAAAAAGGAAAASTAATLGAAAGTAVVAGGAFALGREAAISAGNVAGKAGKMMTDTESAGITDEDFEGLGEAVNQYIDLLYGIPVNKVPEFIEGANHMGLPGSTIEEVGESALQLPVYCALLDEHGEPHDLDHVCPYVQRSLLAMNAV